MMNRRLHLAAPLRHRLVLKWTILALAAGCGQPNQYQAPDPPDVTAAQPLQKTVIDYLEETGTTEAVQKVEIRARVKGFLEQVRFEPGSDVREGDVLYVIEQRPFRAKVQAAGAELKAKEVELDRSKTEFERQTRLFAENATAETNLITAKAQFDEATAAVDAAAAALDQAQLDLEYTEVRAPLDGRVGKTLVKQGNLVDDVAATHLTTIVKYNPIYANFNISERALLELREEAPRDRRNEVEKGDVKIYLGRATDQGFPFEGDFDYADLAVDQSTGTFMIRGIFPNPDQEIVPGLFVRVRIPIGVKENALLVPERASGADQTGRFLLIVNSEDVVERKNVTLGAKVDGMQVVETGLGPDDWVIIDGMQKARNGSKVNPNRTELSGLAGAAEEVAADQAVPPNSQPEAPADQEEAS